MSDTGFFLWTTVIVLIKTNSAFKMSIALLFSSVVMSIWLVFKSLSLWTSSVIILTFSSGMMILFCYSTAFSTDPSYKSQFLNKMELLLVVMPLIVYSIDQVIFPVNLSMSEFTMSSPSVVILLIIIIFMSPMMENCFNPNSPMQSSF